MTQRIFPTRIESRRLVFERLSHETVDLFDLYAFLTAEDWQAEPVETMPWFAFQRVDEVADFVDHAEAEWTAHNSARYLLRRADPDGEMVGLAAVSPEWEARRATSDIILSKRHWGREYGLERAAVFLELVFETYDLDAYYTSCATDNEQSRRMIEKIIDRFGGQYDGLLRHHGSPRPDGTVTDQHRYSILRDEFARATRETEAATLDVSW